MSENISDSYMTPICPTCKREDQTTKAWCCFECFSEWYDGGSGGPHETYESIGNYVRKKHGLPPLAAQPGYWDEPDEPCPECGSPDCDICDCGRGPQCGCACGSEDTCVEDLTPT